MRSINKVFLLGNLGQEPEIRYTPSGSAVANLSLATTYSYKDKQTGEYIENTEWHRIVFFNRTAEVAGEYLSKGSKIHIEGRLQTRKWEDREGNTRYTTEIVGEQLIMLDSKSQEQEQRPARKPKQAEKNDDDYGFDNHLDDDIPF